MSKRIVRDSPVPSPIAPPVLAATSTAVLDVPATSPAASENALQLAPPAKRPRAATAAGGRRFAAQHLDEHASNRQAELFYLQKQIQQQTQMVFVLEDGSRVQGVVEWYDRQAIKVRGKARVLIYKSAIKYLYKAGEIGSAPQA